MHSGSEPSASPKATLRARYRARRSKLDRSQRRAWTAELNRHLLSAAPVAAARRVAAYLAFDGEPDIRFTLTQLHRRGVAVMLPVVPDHDQGELSFHSWNPATPLRANRFGVAEPRGTESMNVARADVVLLPLVAFDRSGGRLGMGAGWYDRSLAGAGACPLRVGVGWSVQEADALPRDDWDVPLHAVATERGWFTCGKGSATMTSPE